MNNAPIGVFDSGMGGLTVMAALAKKLPGEQFIYLGDTARLPYGTKSADTVRRYALQAAHALTERGVKMVVIACNTASVGLPYLKEALAPMPVLGVIEPGAEAALRMAPNGPVAVIATEGTVKGGAYVHAIHDRSSAPVVQKPCPLFVPLAEEGLTEGPIPEAVARRYLEPLLAQLPKPKVLVLGCTHYPVLKKVIAGVAGPDIALVDSAAITADAVAELLELRDLKASAKQGPHKFLVTDAPDRFARVGEIFFGEPIDPGAVEQVDLQ
ncbi:glutamate racemase [Rhizomicrobium palustre]|uniref:Glutamate racemase n=1 Tax=Rhizomicrobium palustre TaxID=189966 RepID=A0A846MXJ8_9PROT|nr:glutamate racemase [Rhizomicrobium palustre]NIK87861.1 glutamate racemase [Rhizomicrobium palustre]